MAAQNQEELCYAAISDGIDKPSVGRSSSSMCLPASSLQLLKTFPSSLRIPQNLGVLPTERQSTSNLLDPKRGFKLVSDEISYTLPALGRGRDAEGVMGCGCGLVCSEWGEVTSMPGLGLGLTQ